MEYRKLGNTDVSVSAICLGTMTWGEQNTEDEAHEQLDYAKSRDINFIDTAELYPVPIKADTYTLTEQYIGNWFHKNKQRDKYILATKIAGKSDGLSWIRNGRNCFDKKNITEALEGSLRRLKTDYIDLYQLHWPDRKTNYFGTLGYKQAKQDDFISIEESLSVLNQLVQDGKIRYIGVSNETPWGVMKFLKIAEKQGMAKIVSIQNPYNLLNRTYEVGLAEISHRENIGLLAYSPLAFGLLTGKYTLDTQPSARDRLVKYEAYFSRYRNDLAVQATKRYVAIAKEHNISLTQMSLAFVTNKPFVASNIIGATRMEQLKENIDSAEIILSGEILKKIEAVHLMNPNPTP